jgi:hypothetical protein
MSINIQKTKQKKSVPTAMVSAYSRHEKVDFLELKNTHLLGRSSKD